MTKKTTAAKRRNRLANHPALGMTPPKAPKPRKREFRVDLIRMVEQEGRVKVMARSEEEAEALAMEAAQNGDVDWWDEHAVNQPSVECTDDSADDDEETEL